VNAIGEALRPPRLYLGEVMHRRHRPVEHAFTYPVFFALLPLQRIAAAIGPLFSHNRWNLFSLHDRDHGARDGTPLLPWLRGQLARAGIDAADGEVWLQTFPRVLGFVFNPVSFWYCLDRAGRLIAILAEVSNTFGERHNYLLAHPDQRPILAADRFIRAKVFHVSPFFSVAGSYRFAFAGVGGQSDDDAGEVPGDRIINRIDYDDATGACLTAATVGVARPWTTGELLSAFFRFPWMTLLVVLRIHWQALRLWRKRVPFFRKPPPPLEETT